MTSITLPVSQEAREAAFARRNLLHRPEALGTLTESFAQFEQLIRSMVIDEAAGEGWQDIATAPKDGTWFCAYESGDTYPCEWRTEEYDEGPPTSGWYDLFNESFESPTHWVPEPDRGPPLKSPPLTGVE